MEVSAGGANTGRRALTPWIFVHESRDFIIAFRCSRQAVFTKCGFISTGRIALLHDACGEPTASGIPDPLLC